MKNEDGKPTGFQNRERDKESCPTSGIKPSLADLVLSVLPWPFHRDLPSKANCKERKGNSQANKER
jgi:hypothetical protein